jgi:hypothetical protein
MHNPHHLIRYSDEPREPQESADPRRWKALVVLSPAQLLISAFRIMMGQKLSQFGAFLFAQARRRSGRRLVLEAFHPLLCGTLHPLAYSSFGHSQSIGYLRLFPAPLL